MKTRYKFSLDKGSKKHVCPECGKKRFVRYVETETGEYLPDQYGKCDRSDHCQYHLNPYNEGYSNTSSIPATGYKSTKPITSHQYPEPDPALVPWEIVENTIRNGYDGNVFIQNLLKRVAFPFDQSNVEKVIALYRLGTVSNGYRAGALTLPYIDELDQVRTVQVKQFDKENHTIATDSLPSMIAKHYQSKCEDLPQWLEAYQKNDLKVSCLFGSHLLPRYPKNRIALVEAPKTAIIGTLYFGLPKGPNDLLWLAVYSKDALNYDRCKVLQGRTVYLFPDLSKDGTTFQQWREKAWNLERLLPGTRIVVSDLIERFASLRERYSGDDIADYLIKFDWRNFRMSKIDTTYEPQSVELQYHNTAEKHHSQKSKDFRAENLQMTRVKPGKWDKEITEIDKFFEEAHLPEGPFLLNAYTPIGNIRGFIDMNLETARAQNGNPNYKHYLFRSMQLMEYIKALKC